MKENERPRQAAGNEKKAGGKKGKRKRPAASGGNLWLWVSLSVAGVLLLAGAGVTALLLSGSGKSQPKPEIVAAAPSGPAGMPPGPLPPGPMAKAAAPIPMPIPMPMPVAPMPKGPETKTETKPPPPPPPPPSPPRPRGKPAASVVRQPVPDAARIKKAELELHQQYREDFAKLKVADDKLALAAKLLQPGREDRTNPPDWYNLLREARELAIQAGRPRLAVEASEDMGKFFLVDGQDLKIKALIEVAKATDPAILTAVAQTAVVQVHNALDEERFDAALQLLNLAEPAAGKGEKKLLETIATRKADVLQQQQTFEAVTKAREKLKAAPGDTAANQIVGQYLCLTVGKWNEGLPFLAKGSDAALAELAKKDLARPAAPGAKIAVGDAWAQHAVKQKDPVLRNVQERALYWYDEAWDAAIGEDRVGLEKRLLEMAAKFVRRPTRLLPGSVHGRSLENRTLLLREGGGTMQSELAIERGLDWLAAHQFPNGMWSLDTFPQAAQCTCGDVGKKFDIGATAMALLPFLGAGELPNKGKHRRTVFRGMTYLIGQQKQDGNFSDFAYENALATIAMCEAFALTRDPAYKPRAQAALNYIVTAQHTGGSWGYSKGAIGDTSVSGWQFSALKAGTYAGLSVPPIVYDRFAVFLDKVADPSQLGYGYNTPGAARATSAVGLLVREYMGWTPHHPLLSKGTYHLLQPGNLPTKERPSLYYAFYGAQVMHHFGGAAWENWNGYFRDMLTDIQDTGAEPGLAHQKGSWSPKGDDWGEHGGRLLSTSLALLCLEIYYYHVPLYRHGTALYAE